MIRDYSLALKTYTEAAENGDRAAQFKVGVLYGLGLGVGQDYFQAVHWYRRAAELGFAQAQSNLGFMYGTGRGVPQDYVQAYAWYNIAAAGGEDTARANRDVVAEKMSRSQIEEAQRVSNQLFGRLESS